MWLYGKIHSLAMESLKFQYSLFIWWRCTELNYRRLKNQYFSRYHSFWWHGKILIVYFPAFFPSSSSFFFSVYINKSGFTDCVFSLEMKQWYILDSKRHVFCLDRVLYWNGNVMYSLCFFYFSFKWESIASLFTSINNNTHKITRNRMQFDCLQLQSNWFD